MFSGQHKQIDTVGGSSVEQGMNAFQPIGQKKHVNEHINTYKHLYMQIHVH